MGVDEAAVLAAREAAAAVARAERAANGRRDRPRLAAVPDDGGVAGEPPRGLGREGASVLELAAALAVVRERRLVDMEDDLVALAAGRWASGAASAASATETSASAFDACRAGRGSAEPRPSFQIESRSASSARRKSAPSSGASRPCTSREPSSAQNTLRYASSCRSRASSVVTRRYARTARSS